MNNQFRIDDDSFGDIQQPTTTSGATASSSGAVVTVKLPLRPLHAGHFLAIPDISFQ
jgi:hypothetical protein